MTEQRDVTQTVREVEYAATSATGNAVVNITNYYYREEIKVASVNPADAAVDHNLPCPYRGLFHFSPNDAEFFFGREVFVEKLVQATGTRNFIPILGASGSGKSSVVLAGLVPKLQKQGNWLFTHFRPGSDPFQKLAEALVPLYAPDLDNTDTIAQTRKLANYLDKGEVILTDVIANIQRSYPYHRVLLIADQFEELYTLCGDEKTRQHFLECLLTIIQSPKSTSDSVIVTTMRADFLENALSYRPFVDVLQNDIKLGSMNQEELHQVIEKPAQKLGVTFQDGLVERILEDVEQQPGSLPLLEFALTLLWEKREDKQLTHTAYEAIGEVQGALASHANEVYSKLNAAEQQQVRQIFMQLVRPGEGMEDTRRVATKSELGEISWSLVKHLADARLIVTSQNAAQQVTVEVVHEALIRHWQLLRSWVDENRSKIIQKNRIERLAMEWRDNKQVKDYLLGGKQLNEAKVFHKEEAAFRLSDLASDFIQKSIRHRQNNRFKLIGVGFIPLVALAVYIGFVVEREIRIGRLWDDVEAAKGEKDSPARILALQQLVKAGISLDGIPLQNTNLSYAKLSNANLSRANLGGTNLISANLSRANLDGANFSRANLSRANLGGTNLSSANFSNAFLRGADISSANFSNAFLISTDLSRTNLSNANLSRADLNGANLSRTNLSNANLSRVDLNGANLSNANFSNANLSSATVKCTVDNNKFNCTNFQGAENLTPQQVKAAENWEQACYDLEFRKQLGLSGKNPKNCAVR